MELITILGLLAGTITTISYLPQVVKTWRTKQTKDISLPMYAILFLGITLWFAYGLLIGDLPVIAANAVSMVLSSTMIAFKLRYG